MNCSIRLLDLTTGSGLLVLVPISLLLVSLAGDPKDNSIYSTIAPIRLRLASRQPHVLPFCARWGEDLTGPRIHLPNPGIQLNKAPRVGEAERETPLAL